AFDWPIAAALLIAFVTHGNAIVPRHRLHVLMAALIAVVDLSAPFAADRYIAIFGDAENYAGLTFLIDMLLLYVATAVAVRAERARGQCRERARRARDVSDRRDPRDATRHRRSPHRRRDHSPAHGTSAHRRHRRDRRRWRRPRDDAARPTRHRRRQRE